MPGIKQLSGDTDIYLLHQIIKGRYQTKDRILDAGCGSGRNLHWFLANEIECYGVDMDASSIDNLKLRYPDLPPNRLQVSGVEKLPFANGFFDHIISSAVLHFAVSQQHFDSMFIEMVRVLKPGGSLFIRMTSDIGLEERVHLIADGVYTIPHGSARFLLTRPLIKHLLNIHSLVLAEPVKTVNVDDIRCMTTLVFIKR